MKLAYICDNKRHLICSPYSVLNLHFMATQLKLKKCWFHKNHYDIPIKRIEEIKKVCQVISTKEIIEIIRHPEYADTILSPSGVGKATSGDFFVKTQIEYNGQ